MDYISRETFRAYCDRRGLGYSEAKYLAFCVRLWKAIARGKDPNRKTLMDREA